MSLRGAGETFLIDTNVLLDMALSERPESEAAGLLLEAGLKGSCRLSVSAASLKDFYYITRKDMNEDVRRSWISFFLDVLHVLQVDLFICREAVNSDEPDFEDGIIRVLAEDAGAAAIISRDEGAFKSSLVRRLTASEALSLL